MNINIRAAQPDDVRVAFPMIHSSGSHEFDHVFHVGNKTTKDYLSFAFPTEWGTQSYRLFTVAMIENHIVGIGAFYSGRDNLQRNLGNFWNVFRFYGPQNILKIAERGGHIESIIPPPESDWGFISQLGVKEEFRGCGVGIAIVQHRIGLTRKLGLKKCVLDVAITNLRAQELYERLGFKVVQENNWNYPDSEIHVPGQRRMELVV